MTTSEPMKHKRKILVIDKPLQSRLIKSVAWPSAIALIIGSALLMTFCFRLATEAFEADVELPSVTPLMLTAAGVLIVTLAIVFFNALMTSHRVAGPLYRVRAVLDQVRDGSKDARIHLRSADYLHEFADSMNEFLDWVEQQQAHHASDQQPAAEVDADDRATSEADAPTEQTVG